jgi:hypothetical protein
MNQANCGNQNGLRMRCGSNFPLWHSRYKIEQAGTPDTAHNQLASGEDEDYGVVQRSASVYHPHP